MRAFVRPVQRNLLSCRSRGLRIGRQRILLKILAQIPMLLFPIPAEDRLSNPSSRQSSETDSVGGFREAELVSLNFCSDHPRRNEAKEEASKCRPVVMKQNLDDARLEICMFSDDLVFCKLRVLGR